MSAMQRSSGSAAQPAVEVITAAKRIRDVTSDQLVGYSNFYRLGFYNIGWNRLSRKHSKEDLATEICDMVRDKRADAVGISEVFNLREHHQERRQNIMEHLLEKLNSSARQPATSTQLIIYGQQCSPCSLYGWVGLTDITYSSGTLIDSPWRLMNISAVA